jgi:coenzyme F420-reducing hydrogenase beta subunit
MNRYGKNTKRQSVILAEDVYVEKLKTMISEHCYDELVEKLTEYVGEDNVQTILPSIAKILVEGTGQQKEHILNNWLDMDSCRVCTTCGKIMEEGWYLNDAGYACSDECAAKSEGITMDEFKRYKIYKKDLEEYLEREGKGRKIEDLSEDECAEIINEEIMDNVDYYWTEWY